LRDPALSAAEVRVGAVMASYANAEGFAWPGTKRLMRETHLSRHLVERARSKLVRGGWFKKTYVRNMGGRIIAVRYLVTPRVLATGRD
jgi:hypothetical protein